jgi:hypothetical protein
VGGGDPGILRFGGPPPPSRFPGGGDTGVVIRVPEPEVVGVSSGSIMDASTQEDYGVECPGIAGLRDEDMLWAFLYSEIALNEMEAPVGQEGEWILSTYNGVEGRYNLSLSSGSLYKLYIYSHEVLRADAEPSIYRFAQSLPYGPVGTKHLVMVALRGGRHPPLGDAYRKIRRRDPPEHELVIPPDELDPLRPVKEWALVHAMCAHDDDPGGPPPEFEHDSEGSELFDLLAVEELTDPSMGSSGSRLAVFRARAPDGTVPGFRMTCTSLNDEGEPVWWEGAGLVLRVYDRIDA